MSIRNQFIFINSKNRDTGQSHDFNVIFNAGYIHAMEDESIKISLVKLTLPLVIHQVNSTNNKLTFINASNQSTLVTIPNGTYNVFELIKVIQGQYPAITLATFDKSRNFFVFTFGTNHRITFNNKSNELLGFTDNITTPTTTITSNTPARPSSINDIVFNLYGVSPVFNNLDNLAGQITLSHALSVIPVVDIPYGTLRYSNDANEFEMSIQDKDIKQLRFVMTDVDGLSLDYANLPDYEFVLKVSFEKQTNNDDMVNVLNEIKEYSRHSFLHTALSTIPE
jgi:hypothetical protein